ncbi:MAG: hypothetical protein ACMG6H_13180 [Acidobacteriota bacterium]
MTDEERQRAMDFIVEQQAKFSVDIEQLNESYRKAEHRFDRDERILKLMIRTGRRERNTRSEVDERLTKALVELTEAQKRTEDSIAHTDSKLDALIGIVREGRNGRS